MTEAEAIRRADAARGQHRVDPSWKARWAERRWITLAGPDPEKPAPVRDLVAWIVRFGQEESWADLALDDRTGAVVRVERSR